MMHDFQRGSVFFYNFEHQDLICSVLINEDYNLVMTGGYDKALVLHDLKTGKTLKRFNMKYWIISCLYTLGSAVAVGNKNFMKLLELETKEMIPNTQVKIEGVIINCINSTIKDNENNSVLLVGVDNCNKIHKITIPSIILKKRNLKIVDIDKCICVGKKNIKGLQEKDTQVQLK